MQLFSSSPELLQVFMQKIDLGKLVEIILRLNSVDITKLQTTEREKLVQSIVQPMQAIAQGGAPGPGVGGTNAMGGMGG